jgi:hypothetical protein
MTHPSKTLIEKMRWGIDNMEQILRDDTRSVKNQIADIEFMCWAMIDAALRLRDAVRNELGDFEE